MLNKIGFGQIHVYPNSKDKIQEAIKKHPRSNYNQTQYFYGHKDYPLDSFNKAHSHFIVTTEGEGKENIEKLGYYDICDLKNIPFRLR